MEISKSQVRKVMLQYRKLIDSAVYINRNELLCEQVNSFLNMLEFQKIHAFLTIKKNKEPNISSLFKIIWSQGKHIVVSKTDFENHEMRHYLYTPSTKLEINEKQIPEPVDAKESTIHDLDIIFVPLLVADQYGNRIGYGGGYYDQLLKETKAIKIGLSLSNPIDKFIQTDEWDIPLDYLITPYKVYNYG